MLKRIKQSITQLLSGKAADGVNVRLLKKTRKFIINHPENYGQGLWFTSAAVRWGEHDGEGNPELDGTMEGILATKHLVGPECGTKACVAGTALLLSGLYQTYNEPVERWDDNLDRYVTDHRVLWQEGGEAALGLDHTLSLWLFDGSRSEKHMPTVLQAIINGERDSFVLRDLEDALVAADMKAEIEKAQR